MKKKITYLFFLLTFNLNAQEKPNFIVVMVDDMGYSDLGCYGSEIHTPNIDKLAREGMVMNNFYNDSRCCPTRASLLTGQYQHKVGLRRNGASLNKSGATIAEVLQQNGYHTAMVGKWHLSEANPLKDKEKHLKWLNHQYTPDTTFAAIDTYPTRRGFDKFYGVIWGVVNCYDPFSLVEGVKAVQNVPKDYYTTHAFTDKAIEYINSYKKDTKPFFMYLAYNAPHWPVQAPAVTIKKYEKTYIDGWDALKKRRYESLLAKKIITKEDYPYTKEEKEAIKWNTLTAEEKKSFAQRMATHAAMIDEVDQGIGRLIAQLKENNQYDNTIIFFMSDNGASPEMLNTPGYQPGYDRPSALRDGTPLQYDSPEIDKIGSSISYTTVGSGWANALNSPYRYWKKESYNGGAKTPFIMTGPGIKKGINYSLAHIMDIMPTCLEIANVPYPKVYKGNQITATDGHSLVPIMKGKTVTNYDDLFFEHQGGKALISGDYKIVALAKEKWALYDLSNDKTETKDIFSDNPKKANEMIVKWNEWAKKMGL
ncbi:arylsulfatase [Flavobacterium flevense]|nr:arylsulfatase [Flavobacterium flevense]SHM16266.1 arylsulfatase [Flavobacterium flevense]